MSYFYFLAIFIGPPLIILSLAYWRARHQSLPIMMDTFHPFGVVLLHVIIAMLYTTPWDNYLVASGVWWYDPALVTGLTLGWVPIEEYIFFIVQTLMTGFWVIWLARRLVPAQGDLDPRSALRWFSTIILVILWGLSIMILATGWQPGTYLGLILVWALPPIMLQTAFGADILWGYRRLVLPGLIVPTIYLSLADTFAIQSGTWTIDPTQTTGVQFPGGLPLEEFVFFLVTNILISFGITLALARTSQQRIPPPMVDKIAKVMVR